MKQPIELRHLRDFGQIINDSFIFLKENFKPLFKALFIICGFFIVISTVSTVFTYMNITTSLQTFGSSSYNNTTSRPLSYALSAMLNAFITVFTQVFIHLVTLCYISVYLQKNNTTPTLAEVWGYFKYYFFRVMGSGILIFFIIVIGCMLCLIPGIYLLPITYLIIPIIVIENSSFRYAFNKSFRLIKDNWWLVFGVIFIMSLIIGVAGALISIPISSITMGSKFFSLHSFTTPLIILFSILRNILLLAYVLPAIAVCLCYFNLEEEKNGTGLLNRIARLGINPDDHSTLPSEEY
ncbi:MAG: hypothetical protein JWQ84_3478 [Mucilaginibacter sp.]|nr:hypothetical protein [Mucilaginibacter sp.]